MNLQDKIKAIKEKFAYQKSDEEIVEHDAYMLMASFLSEIERIQKTENLKRNDLAKRIKTSASYLTQVFRGDKPLNFITLAKIQRALKIKFKVEAYEPAHIVVKRETEISESYGNVDGLNAAKKNWGLVVNFNYVDTKQKLG